MKKVSTVKVAFAVEEPLKCSVCHEQYHPSDYKPLSEYHMKSVIVSHWYRQHPGYFIEHAADMLESRNEF